MSKLPRKCHAISCLMTAPNEGICLIKATSRLPGFRWTAACTMYTDTHQHRRCRVEVCSCKILCLPLSSGHPKQKNTTAPHRKVRLFWAPQQRSEIIPRSVGESFSARKFGIVQSFVFVDWFALLCFAFDWNRQTES